MNNPLTLASCCAAGAALGALFFGGLWWTIRAGLSSDQRAFWIVAGMPLRMILAVTGFYFVSGGRADRLLACLLGFVAARLVATRLVKRAEASAFSTREAGHAPESR